MSAKIGEKRLDKWRKENSYQDLFRNVDCYPKKLVDQMRLGVFPPANLPLEMAKLLDEYISLSLTWKDFATQESVDLQWLRAWRSKNDYQKFYDDLHDDELDERVISIKKDHSRRGEVTVTGCMRADGWRVALFWS